MDIRGVVGFALAILSGAGAVMGVVKYREYTIARRVFMGSAAALAILAVWWALAESSPPTVVRGAICGAFLAFLAFALPGCLAWTDRKQDYDETPYLSLRLLRATWRNRGGDDSDIVLDVRATNEGAPSTLRDWQLTTIPAHGQPVPGEWMSLRKSGRTRVNVNHDNTGWTIDLEADDDLAEKVGNTEIIRRGEERGVLVWRLHSIPLQIVVAPTTRIVLSAKDNASHRIELTFSIAGHVPRRYEW